MSASGKQPRTKTDQPKIPMAKRLRAWWQGEQLFLKQRPKAEAESGGDQLDRPDLLREIWGEDWSDPCSAEHLKDLLEPLGLDPSMTVVDLGDGFGGIARFMVQHYGVWVQALVADRQAAKIGMRASERIGMEKKAAIVHFNPVSHVYRPNVAERVFSKEFFHKVAEKQRVLQGTVLLLKEEGRLMFTDFILSEETSAKELGDWLSFLPYEAYLWTADRYQQFLAAQKMELLTSDDVTEPTRNIILAAWQSFNASGRVADYAPETAESALHEAERWAACVQAIEAGKLQIRRYCYVKRALA
jgi:precorrin-6B methylase 2